MKRTYVAKVTSAGQISLPKELRDAQGIKEDYVVIEPLGDILVIRKLKSIRDELFSYFEAQAKAKKLTLKKLEKLLEGSGRKILKEMYGTE